MKWWGVIFPGSARLRIKLGPFESRSEAINRAAEQLAQEFRKKKYSYARNEDVLTGYGEGGPWFDLRWHRLD